MNTTLHRIAFAADLQPHREHYAAMTWPRPELCADFRLIERAPEDIAGLPVPSARPIAAPVLYLDEHRGTAETESNARLIVAAPELLNALQLAEATLQRIAPDGTRATQGTRDIVRSAIARATGES